MQTTPQCGRYVRALLKLDRPSRLSRASLETLAIVAYRQPITKAEVEQIRGVSVDTIMKTLSDLGLVRLVGRSELPGHPFLYGTTPFFLEHFGLPSLDQLNEIDPTLPRSNPRERARLFKKEEKNPEQAELSAAVEESKPAEFADVAPAADVSEDAQGDGEDDERPAGYVAEDDDIAIDDTPDEFDDDDDDDEFDDDDDEFDEEDEFDDDDDEFDDEDESDDEDDDEEDEYDEEDEDDDEYDEEEDDDEESDDTGGGDDDARRMQSDDDI
jgi:segregation and condensation protein B